MRKVEMKIIFFSAFILFASIQFFCVIDLQAQITFEKNPFEKEMPFDYKPINVQFWQEYEQILKGKENNEVVDKSIGLVKSAEWTKKTKNERAEILLVLAETAYRAEKPFLTTLLIFEINKMFPLGNQAIRSLYLLEKVVKQYNIIDEVFLTENLFDQDMDLQAKRVPQDLKSFVAYLIWDRYDKVKFKYSLDFLSGLINQNTEWKSRAEYKKALQAIKLGRDEEAFKVFESLANDKEISSFLRLKNQLQLARILFEKGEFEKSFDLQKSLPMDTSDAGYLLLERAWNKYYLKHYSKALGLITAQQNPVFINSHTPETFILKALIFKDLCIFKSVFSVKKEFEDKYANTISYIKQRKNLMQNDVLKRWALQHYQLKQNAQIITGLRLDKEWLTNNFEDATFFKYTSQLQSLKEKQIQDRFALKLKDEIRNVADKLLDYSEQISFLDYQTKVDQLKVEATQLKSNYQQQEISFMSFDRLYWDYNGELWLDELENIRVIVKSQCENANVASPKN